MFIDGSCSDDDDDEICYICDHKGVNNGMELLIVWTSGKREWSNIKNVKKDCPNLVKKYMNDKGIVLESSNIKKRISISEILRDNEYGKNEQL